MDNQMELISLKYRRNVQWTSDHVQHYVPDNIGILVRDFNLFYIIWIILLASNSFSECCMIVVTVEGSTSQNEPRHVWHCQIQLFSDDIIEGDTGTFFKLFQQKRVVKKFI